MGPANSGMTSPGQSPLLSTAELAAKTGLMMAANVAKKVLTLKIH
jgi:hypothetical protein